MRKKRTKNATRKKSSKEFGYFAYFFWFFSVGARTSLFLSSVYYYEILQRLLLTKKHNISRKHSSCPALIDKINTYIDGKRGDLPFFCVVCWCRSSDVFVLSMCNVHYLMRNILRANFFSDFIEYETNERKKNTEKTFN